MISLLLSIEESASGSTDVLDCATDGGTLFCNSRLASLKKKNRTDGVHLNISKIQLSPHLVFRDQLLVALLGLLHLLPVRRLGEIQFFL